MTRGEELEGMSDVEINKIMSKLVDKPSKFNNGIFWGVEGHAPPMTTYNWCKFPKDIMPIAIENNIEISPMLRGAWCASLVNKYTYDEAPIYNYNFQAVDDNPYKAICIVFILMKEGE